MVIPDDPNSGICLKKALLNVFFFFVFDDIGINLGTSGNDFGMMIRPFSNILMTHLLIDFRSIQDPPPMRHSLKINVLPH